MNRTIVVCWVVLILILAGGSALPAAAQDTAKPLLAEKGPYGVGVENFTFVDENRDNRKLYTLVWYPAESGRSSYLMPESHAKPDVAGAPYPLVIYSHYLWGVNGATFGIGSHLASYGFVVASISHKDPDLAWPNLIDRPYDVLFVLDQLAALTEGALVGMIDTTRVGVTGYSMGAITTLQLNGGYFDPAYMLDWCATNEPDDLARTPPESTIVGRGCLNDATRWDEITAYRMRYDPPLVEEEHWPALTDERIRAALPMAPCSIPHWGPDGLAAATVPTLYLMPEFDDVCGSDDPIGLVRQALRSPDQLMLIILDGTHTQPLEDDTIHAVYKHFETAFFGYYLQGATEYADYLTPEGVASLGGATLEVGGG